MKKSIKHKLNSLLMMSLLLILNSSCQKDESIPDTIIPSTVTDYDGNIYHTVTIGSQVWMVENLKTTHYRNGEQIPNITDNSEWGRFATGYYCNYNNDTNIVKTYGRLYNYFAIIDSRNVCPLGWHIPSLAEWTTLENHLGGCEIAGNKLKEKGNLHWSYANDSATNESGFFALPGGYRSNDGLFLEIGNYAYFQSSTHSNLNYSTSISIGISTVIGNTMRYAYDKHSGYSVRCIKD